MNTNERKLVDMIRNANDPVKAFAKAVEIIVIYLQGTKGGNENVFDERAI